jgi:hypothetical protein
LTHQAQGGRPVGSGRRDCRVAGSDDGVHCGC